MSEAGNYRGIALSPIAAKITNKMLLNDIQPIWDPKKNYRGSHNLEATIIFVDFKKAFNSIHRHKMLEILREYGVPKKLVDAIGKLYESTFASVLSRRWNWLVSNPSWPYYKETP